MASIVAQGTKPHVLIVGAGLAGLTLAQCLRKNEIPFTVFERERADSPRAQGWSIALHSIIPRLLESMPGDMPDIRQVDHLLPYDLPAELSFFMGEKKFHVISTTEAKIIRANRAKLRSWLLSKIPVQWGTTIENISLSEEPKDQKVKLVVRNSDGELSDVHGDLLVGADGVNSQVREYLVDGLGLSVNLRRFPAGSIVGEPIVDKAFLEKQLQISHSAYVAFDKDHSFHIFVGLKRIIVSKPGESTDNGEQQVEGGQYYWFLNWYDEKAAQASDAEPYWAHTASQKELLDFALEKCTQIDQKLAQVILNSKPEDVRMPPLILRDVDITKMPRSRVTLMGDAAHAMMPFRGEGGLHAMEDAMKLAQALVSASAGDEGLMEALGSYQDEMLSRGHDAMEKSRAAFSGGGGSRIAWGNEVTEASR